MKKILNIFASLSLITSTVSSVVACRSHQQPAPPPPKSEVQKLYNKLNETTKPFLIQNKNFWGKEANYQVDLLKDLEQVAHIPPQDNKMLSFTDQIKPFETPGQVYHIAVNITDPNTAQKKTALVNIDWELTKEQSEIYDFYTNDWPQYIEDSYRDQEQYYQIGKLYEKLWTKKWPANKETTLSWQTFAAKVKNSIKRLIPDDLKIRTATQVGINFLNVGQCQTLQTNPFYLQVGQVEFDLPYYAYSQIYPSPSEKHPSILPKITKWQVGYNNDYNIMQELKKDQTLWSIAEPNTTTTQASSQYNKQQINETLAENSTTSDYNFLTDTDAISYKGTLQTTKVLTTANPILNQIEVYFHDVDQNFKIVVEADYF